MTKKRLKRELDGRSWLKSVNNITLNDWQNSVKNNQIKLKVFLRAKKKREEKNGK